MTTEMPRMLEGFPISNGMKKILQKEAPVLREKAVDVPLNQISSPKIKKIIVEMREALQSQDDGVAIAAPQIGYGLRIFVVSHRVAKITKKEKSVVDITPEQSEGRKDKANATTDTIYINPTIKKLSKEKKWVEEGCLSVRYLYGKVQRASKVEVESYDENGKRFTRGASGLLAQIFQHETDHLDGTLFIDKAKNVEELIPQKDGK